MANGQSPTSNLPSLIRVWRFWKRLDVAAILILVVLLLAAFGSCVPQLSPLIAADPARLAQWTAGVRERFGALTDVLAASGAFRYFQSPIFLIPLALLATATLMCTLNRWQSVWRQVFDQPVRCSDVALEAAPYTAQLAAPPGTGLSEVAQALKRWGFSVRSETAGKVFFIRGDRNRLTSLATLVTHLAVLLLLVGVVLSGAYGWREEITIDPGETVPVEHGSGFAVRNDGFTVMRYPDGSASGYVAQVTIVEGDREARRGSVRVNEPFTYNSVGLHLSGYDGTEDRYNVTLLAVHDPGYGLVIVSGFLLLLGLTVSFHFPHCWIHARLEPDGTLRLAGRADKRACDFEREFALLVEGIADASQM